MKTYYRFYSLTTERNREDLKDVLLIHQIRMKSYQELLGINDDKEGHFYLDEPLEGSYRNVLKEAKLTYMIGCASRRLHNLYMWKRFANDGKGICISFSCSDSKVSAHKVIYTDKLAKDKIKKFEKLSLEKQVLFALLHKRKRFGDEIYENEEEIRFFKDIQDGQYMSVTNILIYLGWKMSQKEVEYWKTIAAKSKIKVIPLRKTIKDNND